MPTLNRILDVYGPQLGELAWHSLNIDDRIRDVSEQHAASMLRAIEHCRPRHTDRPIRILEVGAYAHFGAHRAAAALGGLSVTHDISPNSLRLGASAATSLGTKTNATLVAGDFHDLPFSTGYFDLVFCASSVHHTFRPWRPLREMIRVLRVGGVLHLENEPVGREFSFYGFRGNRAETMTPFETVLTERGTVYTFSSPVPGTRQEALFGMVENERMPLDMLLDPVSAESEIVALTLTLRVGLFEKSILALPRDESLEERLATAVLAEVETTLPSLTDRDRLLGARLPDADEIWRLSYRVAPQLRRLGQFDEDEATRETARIFGASLQATAVKSVGDNDDRPMFRRPVSKRQGVFDDLPRLPGVDLDLCFDGFPAIEDGDMPQLAEAYPRESWECHREENGLMSMLNLASRSRICLPALESDAILLLRFFCLAAEKPYRVYLRLPDAGDLASVMIVQSESRLLRDVIPCGCREVSLETRTLADEPVEHPWHVRLGVGRLIPVRVGAP